MLRINLTRARPGFTALELMITLGIAAVAVTLGVPSLVEFRHNQAMTAAVGDLHRHLALARTEAAQLGVDVVACPGDLARGCADTPEWHDGWILFHDLSGDQVLDELESVIRVGPPHDGLIIQGSNGRRSLNFSPSGFAPGSNASIRFCDVRGPGKARKLVVSSLGRIRRDEAPETPLTQCPSG
jgi:type IV fimbrial biogenesis protein FimT